MNDAKTYENELAAQCKRPGGLKLTEIAADLCGFKKGDKILDVGCAEGATAAYLAKSRGLDVTGIDISGDMIKKAREKHPEIEFLEGDGEFLEFSSKVFDGVFYECVLSLIPNKTEAMHEVFCVLKNKGKAVITDLYHKGASAPLLPKPEVSEPKFEDCGKQRPSVPANCCLNGAFYKDELLKVIDDVGLKVVEFTDQSWAIENFVGDMIFQYGSMQAFWSQVLPKHMEGMNASEMAKNMQQPNIGYFLLVVEKE